MQNRIGTALAVAGLMVAPAVARAQHNMGAQSPGRIMFGAGGGLTLPIGNFGDGSKMGWHALGLAQMQLPNSPIHLRADLMYGRNAFKSPVDGHTGLLGGTVGVLYHFGDPAGSMRPYVLGGLGIYNVKSEVTVGTTTVSGSSTKLAFGLGGGVLFQLGATMHGFAEARYMSIQASGGSLAFIPITFGVMFGRH